MDVEPKIRRAVPDEAELLSELAFRSKSYWGYSKDFMEFFRAELTYTTDDIVNEHFFIAFDNSDPLGFYGLNKLTEYEFELEALFVEPDFIGKGVGRALMNHAKTTAKELGGKKITILGDPNAQSFYQRSGGQYIGNRESDSIPGRFLPLFLIELQ